VRAYPQGEGSGDEGLMLNLELRRRLTRELQAFVFYDAGTVDINRTPFELGANTRTLEGAGLGLLGQFGSAQLRCVLAWPTSGGDPVSDTARQAPRLWFQFTAPL
jgi:hemolysin activation/secretion protein